MATGQDGGAIGMEVRRLARAVGKAALATRMRDTGEPYVSLVQVATEPDGSPLMLLSDLADHTKNLKEDPAASLLFDPTADDGQTLAGSRATLLGSVTPVDDAARPKRYIARQPQAAAYAGFGDFNLYRMAVARAHVVAGFGRIHWLEAEEVLLPAGACAGVAEAEAGIVEHMNQDHADAVQLYAHRLLGRAGGPWVMAGVDPDGIDLVFDQERARLDFDGVVRNAAEARAELVRLVKVAREQEPAAGVSG